MPSRRAGRRLEDGALPGALNMARDEALLALRRVPSLRFYRWDVPTLSLGYFQPAQDLPLDAVKARGCAIVRRSTGGKAILHEAELTYSLCAPEVDALSGGPAAAMTAIHEALGAELARQADAEVPLRREMRLASDAKGSAWCFEDSSPLDLTLGSRKLLGSAARRKDGWILFHGSLVLEKPVENPDIAQLGFEPDREALATAMGQALGYDFEQGDWEAAELEHAKRASQVKFGDPGFTFKR